MIKAQNGRNLKGVLKGDGNVYNRSINVKLNSGEVIPISTLNDQYLDYDSIYTPGDSVIVEKSPLGNKAKLMKPKNQQKIKINLKKQFGGNQAVLVEDGELYKDENGNIMQSEGFNHDDNVIVDEDGNTAMTTGNNGGQVVNAESVVSDSYEKVKNDGRKNTAKEKVLKFSPKEATELLQNNGLSFFKTKKHFSPSELIKEAVDQRNKRFTKHSENVQNDQFNKNSNQANNAQYIDDEEIYDLIFSEQENKKIASGLFDEEDTAQYGGQSTSIERPLKPIMGSRIRDDKGNKIYRDSEGRQLASGEAEPIYPEALLLPGTPAIKGLSKLGNFAVDAINPVGGVVSPSIGTKIAGISKSLSRTLSPSARSGDKFLKDWYRHPETKRRIKERDNYFDVQSSNWEWPYGLNNPNLGSTYKEMEALKTIDPELYNRYSSSDGVNLGGDMNQSYYNPVSHSSKTGIQSTIVHEGTHGVHKAGRAFSRQEADELTTPFNKEKQESMNAKDMYDRYLLEPHEIHARMNEMRYRSNLSPNEKFTEKHFDKLKKRGIDDNGGVPRMLELVDDKAGFIRLMNNFYTPAAVTAGAVASTKDNKKQYGGIPQSMDGLNAYPDQIVEVPSNEITMDGIDYPVEAYDGTTKEYLTTMNPNQDYLFEDSESIIEVPKKQFGGESTIPEPYKIKAGDTLSKIAEAYGLTIEDLLKSNPGIANKNRISTGDTLIIPELTIKGKRDGIVDRMSEVEGLQELPEPFTFTPDTQDPFISTLDVQAETVAPYSSPAPKPVNTDVNLGKIDRTQGTNALREMMAANRTISAPYRTEVPGRTLGYQEENVTPYLDEIDSSVAQQLQYVNQNTTQGQAILANIMSNAGRAKRQTQNRVNQGNLQRRQQTDNANVQLENQFDLMEEQANRTYVDEVNQTLANQDRNKVQQADYLDQLINNNTRLNNAFLFENIKNPNIKIDPITGQVYRIANKFQSGTPKKAKWGLKSKMC